MTARCYLSPDQWGEGEIRLSGREAHHLSRVLRLSAGDEFVCIDGEGNEASAHVVKRSGNQMVISLRPTRRIPEQPTAIALAVGIPGQGKLDEIVNQATQFGVSRLIPLVTQRTVIRESSAAASEKKIERLRRIAVEAIKQSGSGRVPDIRPVCPFEVLISTFSEYDQVLLASVDGPWEDLSDILMRDGRRCLILIGPEGDFTPQEIEQAVRQGARRFSLGPTVLRCETACIAAVALVSYILQSQKR